MANNENKSLFERISSLIPILGSEKSRLFSGLIITLLLDLCRKIKDKLITSVVYNNKNLVFYNYKGDEITNVSINLDIPFIPGYYFSPVSNNVKQEDLEYIGTDLTKYPDNAEKHMFVLYMRSLTDYEVAATYNLPVEDYFYFYSTGYYGKTASGGDVVMPYGRLAYFNENFDTLIEIKDFLGVNDQFEIPSGLTISVNDIVYDPYEGSYPTSLKPLINIFEGVILNYFTALSTLTSNHTVKGLCTQYVGNSPDISTQTYCSNLVDSQFRNFLKYFNNQEQITFVDANGITHSGNNGLYIYERYGYLWRIHKDFFVSTNGIINELNRGRSVQVFTRKDIKAIKLPTANQSGNRVVSDFVYENWHEHLGLAEQITQNKYPYVSWQKCSDSGIENIYNVETYSSNGTVKSNITYKPQWFDETDNNSINLFGVQQVFSYLLARYLTAENSISNLGTIKPICSFYKPNCGWNIHYHEWNLIGNGGRISFGAYGNGTFVENGHVNENLDIQFSISYKTNKIEGFATIRILDYIWEPVNKIGLLYKDAQRFGTDSRHIYLLPLVQLKKLNAVYSEIVGDDYVHTPLVVNYA